VDLQQKHSAVRTKEAVGKVHRVLVEGVSKKSDEMLMGRNTQNTVCVFPKENFKKGDYVNVMVTSCTSTTLIGYAV
jgi:tRNA-2-methylthio-N6-dimethylallyladenosine synthase